MRAFVAVLVVELHFHAAGSLKSKRAQLAPVKSYLKGRIGASVAEIDHQDLWQRATLIVSLTSSSQVGLEQSIASIKRWLQERFVEGVVVRESIHSLHDLFE